jgi:hypothetical protein
VGVLDLISGRTHGLVSHAVSLPFSPYTPAPQWPQFVIDDVIGEELQNLPLSRSQAIAIPAVSKARNLLVSTIAKFPLRAIRVDGETGAETDVTTDHSWLYRTRGPVSPYERMAWTVDDLVFHGVSLWLLDRGSPAGEDRRRPILNAEWCPTAAWTLGPDEDGNLAVLVNGVPIADDRYMLINSPFEGLLNVGMRTLRGARDVEDAWVGRARNPIPMIVLTVADGANVSEAELKVLVDTWAAARTKPNGAIGALPEGVTIEVFGELKPELFVEGRNSIRTDVGSFVNVRVAMLDGTSGIDSLTYTTKDGERNSFYEFDVPFYTDPIAARMSLDDIVPRGTRIRFDMYEAFNLPAATGPRVED